MPLATLTLDDNGVITKVDQCLSRRTVYSNAVLLELILVSRSELITAVTRYLRQPARCRSSLCRVTGR